MYDDPWVKELSSLLSRREPYIGNGVIRTLLPSLQEVKIWIEDKRPYNPQFHASSWRSVISDFQLSKDSLARRFYIEIAAHLGRIEADIMDVSFMDEANRRYRKKTITRIKKLEALIGMDRKYLLLLWDELIATIKNPDASSELINLHHDQFIEIAKTQGFNVVAFSMQSKLSSVLDNNAFGILDAREAIYKEVYVPKDAQDLEECPLDDRLKLCRDLLKQDIKKAHRVVWLHIRRSNLQGVHLDLGAVQLYDSEWMSAKLQKAVVDDKLPKEFQHSGSLHPSSVHDFPAEEHLTFARVDVGYGPTASAVEEARSVITGLIRLGGRSKDDWQLVDSYSTCENGYFHTNSVSRAAEIEREYRPLYDRTATRLNEMHNERKLVTSAVSSRLQEVLELRQVILDQERESPTLRILAATRALENMASWVDDIHWRNYIDDLLAREWARKTILEFLFTNVNNALYIPFTSHFKDLEDELGKIRAAIINQTGRVSFNFNRLEAIKHLPVLHNLYRNTERWRGLYEVSLVFRSGSALYAALDKKLTDFKIMTKRLQRFRNSAQHGGPSASDALEPLAIFSTELALIAIDESIEAILSGEEPSTRQKRNNKLLNAKFKRLQRRYRVENLFA